ncbi:glutamate racemase [Terrihabitans sp. B22-R8]|uniref:glutamate racemase n=1 Tax=Terrihabitans sp. B22-R8 TaxID=3425128 RepID=UPI00403CCECB
MRVDLLAGAAGSGLTRVPDRRPRIGVFDSGLGGLTVHAEIARLLPGAELIYLADTAVFPYGRLPPDVLVERIDAVIGTFVRAHDPDLVVIACNTASTLALPVLRQRYDLPFVGTVPAIKTAAHQTRSRRFSVLATPGTVTRDYTRELIAVHAGDCQVTLVGSPSLASLAEAELRGAPPSDEAIAAEIAPCFVADEGGRTDTIVLACTHYPLLLPRLERLAPWPVQFIDPAPAIARRVASLIGAEDGLQLPPVPSRAFFTSDAPVSAELSHALAARDFGDVATACFCTS